MMKYKNFKQMSIEDMKQVQGGKIIEGLYVTGHNRNGNSCTIDTCYIHADGTVSDCHCDIAVPCA